MRPLPSLFFSGWFAGPLLSRLGALVRLRAPPCAARRLAPCVCLDLLLRFGGGSRHLGFKKILTQRGGPCRIAISHLERASNAHLVCDDAGGVPAEFEAPSWPSSLRAKPFSMLSGSFGIPRRVMVVLLPCRRLLSVQVMILSDPDHRASLADERMRRVSPHRSPSVWLRYAPPFRL